MSFYDAFKDALNVAQKADNIELYRQLLDLSAQALDLQAELAKLKEENAELKKTKIVEERIVRHAQPYITFDDDDKNMKFCAVCWDNNRKLIQMKEMVEGIGSANWITYRCNICNSTCSPDK